MVGKLGTTTTYVIADWNALSFVGTDLDASTFTVDQSTLELSGSTGYTQGVSTGPHAFRSFNDQPYKHDSANYPSGGYLAPADAESQGTLYYVVSSNLVLSVET